MDSDLTAADVEAAYRVVLLPLAAAIGLLTLAGLGVTEAAGLTQVSDFVATVLRIKTSEGTLVVKIDDPTVKVQIDGEELVIKSAGEQEIRLRAGSHRVQTIKDGKPVQDQLVTITRGGKEIVNVEFEPAANATCRCAGSVRGQARSKTG